MSKRLILNLLICTVAGSLVNCADVTFNQNSKSDNVGDSGGGVNPGDPPPDPGDPDPPGPLDPALTPKVQFIGPPCVRQSSCLIEFRLDKSYPATTEFDWRTHDTFYQEPRQPGEPVHAQPNVHYIPTSGHVIFAPGETVKQVFVENINPDNIEILITIIMSKCSYGGVRDSCVKFFEED